MLHLLKRLLLVVLLLLGAAANAALATTSIEFYKADIDHYFMTADSAEATSLDNNKSWNWVRTGKTFDVWLTQASAPSNASPVCRFIGVFANGTLGSHFYTIDQTECAYVKSRTDWGWSYEGNAFYAIKPSGGTCPSGTSPVYRAFNNGMGGAPNHRYMASQTDLNTMVSQGWSSEGIVMCSGSSGSASSPYANTQKLIGGTWTFTYTLTTATASETFSDTFSFTTVNPTPSASGSYYALGTDQYGDPVSGGYYVTGGYWNLLNPNLDLGQGLIVDEYFTFTFTDSNHVSGCYYLISPAGSSNFSNCYSMVGSRSPLQPLGKSFDSSVALPLYKDTETLMQEVANDTDPGFVDPGVVEAYLSHREKTQ